MRKAAGWGLALPLLAPAVAMAQQRPLGDLRFDLAATARAEYDSNVTRRPVGVPSPSGLARHDTRFNIGLTIDAVSRAGPATVFLNGAAGYDFYSRNTRLNRERIALTGGAELPVSPFCTVRLTGNLARRQSDLADLLFVGGPITDSRNTETIAGADLNAACAGAIGLRPSAGARIDRVTNSAALRERNDYVAKSLRGQLGYGAPGLGDVSVYANFKHSDYTNRTGIPGISDSIEVVSGGASYERTIGLALQGRVAIGYTKVTPKGGGPGVRGFSGLSYSADLTYRAPDFGSVRFTGARDASQSNLFDASYVITDTLGFAGEFRAGRAMRVVFGLTDIHRRYEAPISPFVLVPRRDNTISATAGLRFRVGERIQLGLDGTSTRRRSGSNPLFNYRSIVGAASVRIAL